MVVHKKIIGEILKISFSNYFIPSMSFCQQSCRTATATSDQPPPLRRASITVSRVDNHQIILYSSPPKVTPLQTSATLPNTISKNAATPLESRNQIPKHKTQ